MPTFGDIAVELGDDHVALVEVRRPPNNHFSLHMLGSIADALEWVDAEPEARAIVLGAEGKNFCAGADLDADNPRTTSEQDAAPDVPVRHIYDECFRMFSCRTPLVAAVQGAAVGGGLGLACMADFRVGGPSTRMTANFARLGFHHGFGLSVTLPGIVGQQTAMDLLYTGKRIKGDEANRIGLLDRYVENDEEIRAEARRWAADIAISAPLAVESIRQTLRGHLAGQVRAATDREKAEQDRLRHTSDFKEGVKAMAQRRDPDFTRS